MASSSRIPALQDQLKTLLAARLTSTQITVGEPGDPRPIEYVIVSGIVTEWTQEYITIQPELKQETFRQNVHIIVQRPGTYQTARDRAFAIAAEVEDELRDNPKLTNQAYEVALASGQTGEILEGEFRAVIITLTLDCATHLT